MYPDTTVYIIGHARTQADNAITEHFKGFFIGVVVDYITDEILDISCSSTIPTLHVQTLLEAFDALFVLYNQNSFPYKF